MVVTIVGNGFSVKPLLEKIKAESELIVTCNYGWEGLKSDVCFITDSETVVGFDYRGTSPNTDLAYMAEFLAYRTYNNMLYKGYQGFGDIEIKKFKRYQASHMSSGLYAYLNVKDYCPEVTKVIAYGMDCMVDSTTYRSNSNIDKSYGKVDEWMLGNWVNNWKLLEYLVGIPVEFKFS
jgi:hypothetical protein